MAETPDFGMKLTNLPDLHPDAIGATIQGKHYTRAEYERLQAASRTPMPETPDFEQIARRAAPYIGDDLIEAIAEQLRLVWNARGAADLAKIDALKARVSELEALLDDVPPGT